GDNPVRRYLPDAMVHCIADIDVARPVNRKPGSFEEEVFPVAEAELRANRGSTVARIPPASISGNTCQKAACIEPKYTAQAREIDVAAWVGGQRLRLADGCIKGWDRARRKWSSRVGRNDIFLSANASGCENAEDNRRDFHWRTS